MDKIVSYDSCERFPDGNTKGKYKGTIPPRVMVTRKTQEGDTLEMEKFDILGWTVYYSQRDGVLEWTMSEAIERMLKWNGFENVSGKASTPCIPSQKLELGDAAPDYPLRKLVGW